MILLFRAYYNRHVSAFYLRRLIEDSDVLQLLGELVKDVLGLIHTRHLPASEAKSDLDLIALAGLGSLRPRLEDTDCPEILVYSDTVHSEKGLVQYRSFIILSGQSRLSLGVDVGIRLL